MALMALTILMLKIQRQALFVQIFFPASTGSSTFVLFHVGVFFIFAAFGIGYIWYINILKWIPDL